MEDIFDTIYASYDEHKGGNQIFKQVYQDDCLPQEFASFNFTSLGELRRLACELQVGYGQTLVDLACGIGGPGLWLARETGARLVGIDFSGEAIRGAVKQARRLGMENQAAFQKGEMAATRLPDQVFDGAVSIDALFLAPDKQAVLKEVARILRPGARFGFTNWLDRFPAVPGKQSPVYGIDDYRPWLGEAGFEVETYVECPDWERRMRAVYLSTLAHRDEIIRERGEQAAQPLLEEARAMTELHEGKDLLMQIRRILVVARRA